MSDPNSILKRTANVMAILGLTFAAAPVWADDVPGDPPPPGEAKPDSDNDGDVDNEQITNDGDLPAPTSDDDAQPEVAGPPALPPEGVVEQAGVGGPVGYGRVGVLELGGSAGFTLATNISQMTIAPSFGWFVTDNLELSTIMDLTRVETEENSSTIATALIEPSYHLPFNRTTFGFLGLGMGVSYVEELGAGFAMAPRIGANFLVGRSGVLTPSASWQYTTHDVSDPMGPITVVAVSSALRLNIGYTVMW
jgi:hypothetical protein